MVHLTNKGSKIVSVNFQNDCWDIEPGRSIAFSTRNYYTTSTVYGETKTLKPRKGWD